MEKAPIERGTQFEDVSPESRVLGTLVDSVIKIQETIQRDLPISGEELSSLRESIQSIIEFVETSIMRVKVMANQALAIEESLPNPQQHASRRLEVALAHALVGDMAECRAVVDATPKENLGFTPRDAATIAASYLETEHPLDAKEFIMDYILPIFQREATLRLALRTLDIDRPGIPEIVHDLLDYDASFSDERSPQVLLLAARVNAKLGKLDIARGFLREVAHWKTSGSIHGQLLVEEIVAEQASLGETDSIIETLDNASLGRIYNHEKDRILRSLIELGETGAALLLLNTFALKPELKSHDRYWLINGYQQIAEKEMAEDPVMAVAALEQGVKKLPNAKLDRTEQNAALMLSQRYQQMGMDEQAEELLKRIDPARLFSLKNLEGKELIDDAKIEEIVARCKDFPIEDQANIYSILISRLEEQQGSEQLLQATLPLLASTISSLSKNSNLKDYFYTNLIEGYLALGESQDALKACASALYTLTSERNKESRGFKWDMLFEEYMKVVSLANPTASYLEQLGLTNNYMDFAAHGSELSGTLKIEVEKRLERSDPEGASWIASFLPEFEKKRAYSLISIYCSEHNDTARAKEILQLLKEVGCEYSDFEYSSAAKTLSCAYAAKGDLDEASRVMQEVRPTETNMLPIIAGEMGIIAVKMAKELRKAHEYSREY